MALRRVIPLLRLYSH